MNSNVRRRWLVVGACLGLVGASGCFEDPLSMLDDGEGETGDGDGDPGDGDGDSGDGDGDSGDGDGDSGDGDGDSGDGDGDGDSGDGDGDSGEVVLFDLWALACDAEWLTSPDLSSGATVLICNAGDAGEGAITQHDMLTLEDGSSAIPALQVTPWSSIDGVTSGLYVLDLSGTIKPTLRTEVACADNMQSCDVQWQIHARLESDPEPIPPVFEDGFQTYDGQTMPIEIDLSGLLGVTEIAFVVTSNGEPSSADALVFAAPRIVEAP